MAAESPGPLKVPTAARAGTLLAQVTRVGATIAGAALLLLMGAIVADVIGRHLKLFTIPAMLEISYLATVMIGLVGLPDLLVNGNMIVTDVLSMRWRPRIVLAVDGLWNLVAAAGFAATAVLVAGDGLQRQMQGEVTPDARWPLAIFFVPAVLGLALAALAALILGIGRFLAILRRGQPGTPAARSPI